MIGARLSLVIPARNEARNLAHVFGRIPAGIEQVILVDGHSTDDTVEEALRLRPDVTIVRQLGRGKGDALRAGFEAATGDIIVMLDADGSTDPSELHRYVSALFAGADLAKGTRHVAYGGGSDDITRVRAAGNRALTAVVNLAFGARYTDLCYGYAAFWRHALERLELDCDGFEVETSMNIRASTAGLTVAEVPSSELPRLHGESNLSAMRDGLRVLRVILTEPLPGPRQWRRSRRAGILPDPITARPRRILRGRSGFTTRRRPPA